MDLSILAEFYMKPTLFIGTELYLLCSNGMRSITVSKVFLDLPLTVNHGSE